MLRYSERIWNNLGFFKQYKWPSVFWNKIYTPCASCCSRTKVQRSFKHTYRKIDLERETNADRLTRHFLNKYCSDLRSLELQMDASLLLPPASVRGMTTLDREGFLKKISVPFVKVKNENVHIALKQFKKYLLKMEKLKPVQTDAEDSNKKIVLLNPLLVQKRDDVEEELLKISECEVEYSTMEITLCYENWRADDILRSVLPVNQEGAQGYSIIGHILHLNLRDHLLPYKTFIGEVLLEKIANITLVVNKTSNIDSTFRNFQMETLAGTGATDVTVKENGCSFSFDFAKVYWNPRLSTEHERIVKKIKYCDILYDVMAGVGPFAIPAGKKKCEVLANDLNPHSYESLVRNCSINKVKERVKCFNLDGHQFIKTILKESLLKVWQNEHFIGAIHITMNLPAMAVEFLPSFKGLFSKDENVPENPILPLVHVYMFSIDTEKDTAINIVAQNLGCGEKEMSANSSEAFDTAASSAVAEGFEQHVDEVAFVRSVSQNKHMMRVSFRLPLDMLCSTCSSFPVVEEPPSKKLKESSAT